MSSIFANYPAFIVLNVILPPRRIFFGSKPCELNFQSSRPGRSKYLSLNRLFRVELIPYIQKNHNCCAMDAMSLVNSREPYRIISAGRGYGRSDIISIKWRRGRANAYRSPQSSKGLFRRRFVLCTAPCPATSAPHILILVSGARCFTTGSWDAEGNRKRKRRRQTSRRGDEAKIRIDTLSHW